jgi:hypothetical protein
LAGGLIGTVAHIHDWPKAIRDIERARPRWAVGEVPIDRGISQHGDISDAAIATFG